MWSLWTNSNWVNANPEDPYPDELYCEVCGEDEIYGYDGENEACFCCYTLAYKEW